MKAVLSKSYGSEDSMKIGQIPKPIIGADEALVQVKSASVNPVDWKIRSGQIIAKTGFKPPLVLGSDFAGEIVELGDNVDGYNINDKVWGKVDSFKGGSYAEYIKVRVENISYMPENMNTAEAASIPNVALTAYQAMVHKAGLKNNQSILINGASGGVGLMAVQIAKSMDCHVTAVCSGKNKELVQQMGADTVIDYNKEKVNNSPNTFDVFFDCVANKSLFKIKKLLKTKGVYIRTIPSIESLILDQVFKIFKMKRSLHIMVKPSHNDLMALKKMVENKKLRAVIQKIYPIEEIADAHRDSKQGHVVGKLALKI